MMTSIDLVSPLPMDWIPLLWQWLREDPQANFDDYAPTTLEDFRDEMTQRLVIERSWGVLVDGAPVGAIGYFPATARLGMLHGICFTRQVCGTGVARVAVQRVLDELFATGVDKVCVSCFVDNVRVHRFLASFGAVTEGLQNDQTIRQGQPIAMSLMAIFNPARMLKKAG
jgi:RimJ/RimL family protein N-acetyltransferase